MERWRSACCATNETEKSSSGFYQNKHTNLFIKFNAFPCSAGYQVFLTDFNGRLWQERLEGQSLQDRLKSEASGLEIESADLLKLLDEMCKTFVESSCESSSDSKTLILRTFVKIGFIKLKWTFKTEICEAHEYEEMIKKDFLLPFFANFRADRILKDEIDEEDLVSFYELVKPESLKKAETVEKPLIESPLPTTEKEKEQEFHSLDSNATESPLPLAKAEPVESVEANLENIKRRELEEQLQAAKKKKKKLI